MVLRLRINYNKKQIMLLLLCNKYNDIFLPPEIYHYIINFLDDSINLDNLTNNIERLQLNTTTTILYDTLWPDIERLRADPHKEIALNKWIYGDIYREVEEDHLDNNKMFTAVDTWEKSFVLEISWLIFHG